MPSRPRIAFVTGKLAEPSLRRVVDQIAKTADIDPVVVPLNIQVAALMTVDWVAKKLSLPVGEKIERVVLPGYCRGDVAELSKKLGVTVESGPRDLHDLPFMFGKKGKRPNLDEALDDYDIQIIAEINHAPRLSTKAMIDMAEAYRADGADMIDLGCDPQADRDPWPGVAEVVRELRARGFKVSIDSFHPAEVEAACRAGAELVLSVNSSNMEIARDFGAEVVVIPDVPSDLASLDRILSHLSRHGVKHRIDPIIEPIGLGFSSSLVRYVQVRERYPNTPMMMGIGNLSEMTEVDSAGVNMLLIGFCQEQKIQSVLTTQVINYARSSVCEIDLARRIAHRSVARRTPPKHMGGKLVSLRDVRLRGFNGAELEAIHGGLTDRNIRIFIEPDATARPTSRTAQTTSGPVGDGASPPRLPADEVREPDLPGVIHVMNKDFHFVGRDPFVLFDQMKIDDPSHAFYLGYELAKAATGLTLHKNYTQDVALQWGPMTVDEISHHERRKKGSGPDA